MRGALQSAFCADGRRTKQGNDQPFHCLSPFPPFPLFRRGAVDLRLQKIALGVARRPNDTLRAHCVDRLGYLSLFFALPPYLSHMIQFGPDSCCSHRPMYGWASKQSDWETTSRFPVCLPFPFFPIQEGARLICQAAAEDIPQRLAAGWQRGQTAPLRDSVELRRCERTVFDRGGLLFLFAFPPFPT